MSDSVHKAQKQKQAGDQAQSQGDGGRRFCRQTLEILQVCFQSTAIKQRSQ